MKRLLLLVMAAGLATTFTMAQEQKTQANPTASKDQKPVLTQNPKDMKQDRAEWEKKIKEELKLTDEQTVKYNALNKEYNDKIDAVLKDESLSKDVQKEKKMALKKEKEAKLMELLTDEQKTTYKQIIEKKKAGKTGM